MKAHQSTCAHIRFSVFLTVIITHLAVSSPRQVTEIFFELEPSWISAAGVPSDSWLSMLMPARDNNENQMQISHLRIPASAAQHPLLKGIFRLDIDKGRADDWKDKLMSAPGVKWAEPPPVRYTCGIPEPGDDGIDAPPDDPYYPLQWSLHRINAAAGWDITQGDTNVVIAVVDIGTDITHRDLSNQMWVNRLEIAGNGVDDDGNGFVDDIYGWDFHADDSDPRPDGNDEHGTHVSGIACAAVNNSYGIAGLGGKCRLMAIRTGQGSLITHGYEGVIYAAAMGADIINLSWGGGTPSNIERITIDFASEQGALIVAAAGNLPGNHGEHYPAAYVPAVAVTAVDDNDRLASFSNFGPWVDVSAPGEHILSTIPGGFGLISGTSMATPLVAAAAALLKSIHPDWQPEQLKLQLLSTSDPIDSINPDDEGNIGRGRLNVFRTLTEDHSGFALDRIHVDDSFEGNDNGIIEPGERLRIMVTISNKLAKPAHVSGRFVSSDRFIQITPLEVDFGELSTGMEADNNDTPFIVRISPDVRQRYVVECFLNLTTEGGASQTLPITLQVQSPFDHHDAGEVTVTLTNFGAIGYWDYLSNAVIGESFRYPAGGLGSLYHGSLMIGSPPDRVSDCAYGDGIKARMDFAPLELGFKIQQDLDGNQTGVTSFDDVLAENPLRVRVEQSSYSYVDPPNNDFLILNYKVINRGSDIDSLYIGLYLDWDIVQADQNRCLWDGDLGIGWFEFAGGGWPLYGVAVIDQPVGFHVAVDNRDIFPTLSTAWTDEDKIGWMQSGFTSANSTEVYDWSQLTGVGPLSVNSQDTVTVTFAMIAGDDLADLSQNLQAARNLWNDAAPITEQQGAPNYIKLLSVYPSPFNGVQNVSFMIGSSGFIEWYMSDISGRMIKSSPEIFIQQGRSIITVDGRSLPSGRYMLSILQNGNRLTLPMTLIR